MNEQNESSRLNEELISVVAKLKELTKQRNEMVKNGQHPPEAMKNNYMALDKRKNELATRLKQLTKEKDL